VLDLGFEEMTDAGGVTFVEWGDAIDALLPESHVRISPRLEDDSEERWITVDAEGPAWAERWERLESALEPWAEEVP